MTGAVFLDRDGVINDPVLDPVDGRPEAPLRPEDVVLSEGAVEGIAALHRAGWPTIVVSNQPAAAKGKATLAQLAAVHDRVIELLASAAVAIDDWRYCHHHPHGLDPALTGVCDCRKPAPGMLLDAASEHGLRLEESWMIGDTDADLGAGQRAGCRTVLIHHPGSAHRRSGGLHADAVARNLSAAATLVLEATGTIRPLNADR